MEERGWGHYKLDHSQKICLVECFVELTPSTSSCEKCPGPSPSPHINKDKCWGRGEPTSRLWGKDLNLFARQNFWMKSKSQILLFDNIQVIPVTFMTLQCMSVLLLGLHLISISGKRRKVMYMKAWHTMHMKASPRIHWQFCLHYLPHPRFHPRLPDGYSQIFRLYLFGPSGFWTMAPLRYAAKFDPFLYLDCAPTPSTLAQSKERKGSNFAA